MKAKYYLPIAALALMSLPATAAWQRLGGIDKRPTDIASSSIKDVAVVSSTGTIGQPENLLADDVSKSSKLGAGNSEVVIRIHRQADVEVVSLISDGAEGRVEIATSADNKSWAPVAEQVFSSADRLVTMKFASTQARYIKLQFDLGKGGDIRSLSVYGSDSDADFPVEDSTDPAGPQVNLAGGVGGTRVIYMHPNSSTSDDSATRYNRIDFGESQERFRTIVYDLGRERTLTEVGSVHSARPVRFYAYTYRDRELPEKEDWRGRMSFDPGSFDTVKPLAVVEDNAGLGYTKARFERSVVARYVALRWEPDFNPPSFFVGGVSLMGSVKALPTFQAGGAAADNKDNNKAAAGNGQGGNGDGNVQGDAARRANVNPFQFTSAAFGATRPANPAAPPPTSGAARPRPRPRPRSP
ncbi:MAG: hypothetical protein JNJ83_15785 [Verrucomicrobiaceae bacterium]|nr:hypothetical protein [Verrucomicrobiaceae bacterium]